MTATQNHWSAEETNTKRKLIRRKIVRFNYRVGLEDLTI